MIQIQRNQLLSSRTTLEFGGPAKFLIECDSDKGLLEALQWAKSKALPVLILGEGSNMVVSDKGWDGLVIVMKTRDINVQEKADAVFLKVAAGESWDALVERTVRNGWAGLECLSGIPGLVGATPIQNVGAYGQEVSQVITHVEALHVPSMEKKVFSVDECDFGYRSSFFKKSLQTNAEKKDGNLLWVILSVTFKLVPQGDPVIRYPELKKQIEKKYATPTLSEVRETVLALRRKKSMVVDIGDPNHRSAGSFFTNPLLSKKAFEQLVLKIVEEEIVRDQSEVPHFAFEDAVKVPAAWLIEKAGFQKGFRKGQVGISSKHSLALVHHGGGSAVDLMILAQEITEKVYEIFDVELHMEPVKIGFE